MRNIIKQPEPTILADKKAAWTDAYLSNPSENNRYKYRHPEINSALKSETSNKCVYCESKIGHNCPGDIEHKTPVSVKSDLIFEWNNMTIACTECNRRKLDYYDPNCMFLDPNTDDVESVLHHVGIFVFNLPGNKRSEITVRILELNDLKGRPILIDRKCERLEFINNLAERIATEDNAIVKSFLIDQLKEAISVSSEFSGMIKTYVESLPVSLT